MTDKFTPSTLQRIEDAINAAGLRATGWALGTLQDFHPPRWLVRALWIAWAGVLLADLRGDLSFHGWVEAMLDIPF